MKAVAAAAVLVLAACGTPPEPVEPGAEGRVLGGPPDFTAAEVALLLTLSPLPDPPDDPTNAVYRDPAAARLGRFLFFDTRLSGDGDVACVTCHSPAKAWGDGKELGEARGKLTRHSMTLWNVAYNRWFFWDGRKDSLWSQALQPLEDPREHGGSRLSYAHLLHDDPDLRRAYEDVFGPLPDLSDVARFPRAGRPVPDDPEHPHDVAWRGMDGGDRETIDRVYANLGKALAAFERGIVSRQSPFDRFVEGVRELDAYKQLALSREARRGLKLFLGKARCLLCHNGPDFTDREFHDNRVPPLGGGRRLDPGRYEGVELVIADPFNGTGRFSDAPLGAAEDEIGFLIRKGHNWSEFKTPTLRNVIVTAPYMHQGQMKTLDEVVRYYSTLADAAQTHHQAESVLQPVDLSEQEIADLVAFLESLTDTSLAPELLGPPETPWMPEDAR